MVLSFDDNTKRYSVRVEGDSQLQAKPLGLKAINLKHDAPVSTTPPSSEAGAPCADSSDIFVSGDLAEIFF